MILFWGEDEFLLRLAALSLLEERGIRATEVDAAEWRRRPFWERLQERIFYYFRLWL